MAENEFARRTCSRGIRRSLETPDVQYVDVKRIMSQNYWNIRALQLYYDIHANIQRIMNEPISKELDSLI